MAHGFGMSMLNRYFWCPRYYYLTQEEFRERIKERCIELANKSPCLRMHYGAIVVKNGRIVGEGFNIPIIEGVCERECIRDVRKIIHGSNLEICYAFHAERMALMDAGKKKAKGADLYLLGFKPNGTPVKMTHPKFVACVICAIHENAYGIRYIYFHDGDKWSKPVTPKEALETAMMLAVKKVSYV